MARNKTSHEDNSAATNGAEQTPGQTIGGEEAFANNGVQNDEGANAGSETAAAEEGKKNKRTDEEKSSAFSRLASNRSSNAMDALNSLGHLANTTSYLWTEEQESKIFDTLSDRIAALRKSFSSARVAAGNKEPGKRGGGRAKALSISV